MKWNAENHEKIRKTFTIERVVLRHLRDDAKSSHGFYLYVYEDGKCTHDYLQDTLEAAVEQAFEQFEVPTECWRLDLSPSE